MRWNRLAALALFGLLGCVSLPPPLPEPPELPEKLDGDGLLIGRMYTPANHSWDINNLIIINGRKGDGVFRSTELHDGYFAIRLPPGEHIIREVRNVFRDHHISRPINQKFTIRANRITSIGMYVFLTDPKVPNKFRLVKLENAREMSHFLDANYPRLMTSLADRSLLSAPAKYLETTQLSELRQAIAANRVRFARFHFGNIDVVYGNAGTLATLTPDANGNKEASPKMKVLDTGTLADIKLRIVEGDRLIFITDDAQMLILENGQLLRRAIPHRVQPLNFSRLGDKGLLVVDSLRRVLTSHDDGRTWTNNESAMLEKPTNWQMAIIGRDAAYVYSLRGVPRDILVYHYNKPTLQILPGPRDTGRILANHIPILHVTDIGLYISYHARDFHFKPNGQADWQLRKAPAEKCGQITVDSAGLALTVTCNDDNYRSEDGGQNWVKREAPAT